MKLFLIIEQISLAVMLLCFVSFVILMIFIKRDGKKKPFHLDENSDKTKFAVLIPARNESSVIEPNIRSLLASDYPKEKYEIFVIVESESDPTAKIVEKYGNAHLFVRRDLENKHMKGYALDECLKYIFSGTESYEAFLILDADNIVSRSFLSYMSDAYRAGFDAACGKRDNKNWNSSVVSSASALTFTAINTLQNKPKTDRGINVMVSGTGFYVAASVLEGLGGWPFASLTEDYEFSNYAVINNLKTCYVEAAVYYDEQPDSIKQSIVQRTRWVRGFFQVKKRYRQKEKEMSRDLPKNKDLKVMKYGTTPLLILAIDIVVYLLATTAAFFFSFALHSGRHLIYANRIIFTLFIVYTVIALFTVFLFQIEKGSIDITEKNKIKTVFYHPIFLATYLISAARCLFVKDKWEVIKHGERKQDKK